MQPSYEEQYDEPRGFWARMRERIIGAEEAVEGDEQEPLASVRSRAPIRLETARGIHVAVRMNATVFNDARQAADGLKNGHQQIVNLERAASPLSERIVDFLSGVTYALDGAVEKIGERVYLFAPANVEVEVDSGPLPSGDPLP